MLKWLYMYVSSVCSKCFICFRCMLQVFHLEVAKVDLDVACIYMQMFHVFSYLCCKCFIWMFAYIRNDYTHVFKYFFGVFCKCFKRMLQVFELFRTYIAVFYLDVAKVDQMLHMLQ
jgi:hypothetical protein